MKFEQRVRQWWLPLIRARWSVIRMQTMLVMTRKRVIRAIGIVVALLVFALIVYWGYILEWQWTGFPSQKLWDWFELLIVPVVLAIGGYLFARAEGRVTEAATERRAQDEALQAYLDYIGELALEKGLRNSKEHDEVRTLARARTLTALTRLDAEHNRAILHFLKDSNLVSESDNSIISLQDAPLLSIDLEGNDLRHINLERAMLAHANLRFAYAKHGVLQRSWLRHADLRYANLENADLRGASLLRADLRHANLRNANLSVAEVPLGAANLMGADLRGANLENTDLTGADLTGAKVSKKQLAECQSLARATMPDGQPYEE